MIRDKKKLRLVALFLLFNFLGQILFPTAALALNGGPNSPEFSSFEPVATTDMVNPFTGDFTYNLPVINVPGTDGAGYPLSLSYHSGASSEEEASWVGFGWTLNPGAINRSMRGFPDDYKNVPVKQYNKVKPNWSASVTLDGSIEFKSKDKKKKEPKAGEDTTYSTPSLSLGASHSLRFNNYQGFSASTGFNAQSMGLSVGANITGGEVTFSAAVNPIALLNSLKKKKKEESDNHPFMTKDKDGKTKFTAKNMLKQSSSKIVESVKGIKGNLSNISAYGLHSFGNFSSNISVARYKGVSYDWSANLKVDIGQANVGFEVGYSGNYNVQANEPLFDAQACGYMYNPNITTIGTNDNTNKVSDYYTEKASSYDTRDHFLGMPFNNADMYSLTGEGLGGGFQLFHREIGHYYPNFLVSEQKIKKMALEFTLGFSAGKIIDVGVGFDFIVPGVGNHKVKVSDWKNLSLICEKEPSDFQFNQGDKGVFRFNNDLGGSVVYSRNGNTDAVSAEVSPPSTPILPIIIPTNTLDVQAFINNAFSALPAGVELPDVTGMGPGDTINLPCIPIPQVIPGAKRFYPELGGMGISDISNTDYSVGGSSYIDFNTYPLSGSRFENDPDTKSIVDILNTSGQVDDGVAEMSIHNENGMRYIYGLPVYARNEKNFQVGREFTAGATVENNYIYYPSAAINIKEPLENKTVVGETKDKPYATSYLLTQINTPDYVDIGTPGAGPEDFGGWTKFGYRSADAVDNSLASSSWYHYRTPYSGLLYQKSSLSYKGDDMGSVSLGEKQVYYLKVIETKTHVAFFITNKTTGSEFDTYIPASIQGTERADLIASLDGTGTDRPDGLGARYNSTDYDPASLKGTATSNNSNTQKLEKLERIVLFAKSRFVKPLQTTHFEYNNSLVRNLPNSVTGSYPANPSNTSSADYLTSGKLTLKRVWFEYEGTVPAKISPYVFNYEYRTDYTNGAASGTKYAFLNEMSRYGSNDQNPDYRPEALDIWGNYQYKGDERQALMQPWVSQKNRTLTQNDYDPAAWQLKQIILPSGGEINVQYEEGDYCYVQDRDAMAMVSLENGSTDSKKPEDTKYFIHLNDIGLSSLTSAELIDLRDKLRTYFNLLPLASNGDPQMKDNERKKIFFKFLYALKGNDASLDNCKSEYISGYTSVSKVDIEGGKICLSLGTRSNGQKKNVPKWVAYSYLTSLKNGFVENNDCDSEMEEEDQLVQDYYHYGVTDDLANFDKYIVNNSAYNHGNNEKFKKAVVRPVLKDLTNIQFQYGAPDIDDVCKAVNYPLSYLRLPLLTTDKKGGGIRVKRLLMYDSGANMENGDVSVYGTEYSYKLANGRSSGVATNEPESEENALKTFLPRLKQSFISKMIAGRDKEQAEGPLGESLLPSPSIGYSRIVIKNIHTGETGSGYKIDEYYTSKDFAFDRLYEDKTEIEGKGVEYTDLKDNRRRDKINLPLGLFNYRVDKRWVAQGFRFVINNMHGQVRKMSTYGDGGQLSTFAEYDYFLPGEKVPMLTYDKNTGKYTQTLANPGKEEQITAAMSSFSDINMNLNLELDLVISFTATGATATFGAFPTFNYNETELNTHVTTKVLRYPVILRGVTNYQDGIINKSQHLAFNPHTGKPVLTKTTDGYDGLRLEKQNDNYVVVNNPLVPADDVNYQDGAYYTLGLPASWIYEEMGQKSKTATPSTRTNQLDAMAGSMTYYGNMPFLASSTPFIMDPNPAGVVAATAQTFRKNWYPATGNENVDNDYLVTAADKVELNKKWHPEASYSGRVDISSANASNQRIYTGGIYTNFIMFDWNSPPANTPTAPWIFTSMITKYSPNGLPLEEKNILDVYSANRYGYGSSLVTMSGKNTAYETMVFEDYENSGSAQATSVTAHSGKSSWNYNTNPGHQFISPAQNVKLNQQVKSNGALIKVWVRSTFVDPVQTNPNNGFKAVLNSSLIKHFSKVAQTGEWTLYEAKLAANDLASLTVNSNISLVLDYNISTNEMVYMDDFRFQPLDAQAVCYVYDVASRRLLTQFDDQHFGVYYQYNNEGKLVRKQMETERGMKTIQETQYNSPLVLKNIP